MSIAWGTSYLDPKYQGWVKAMQVKGLLPEQMTRLIIDISMEKPVTMYVEALGDDAIFEGDLMDVVCQGDIVRPAKKDKEGD
jgi:hypothetical protein